MIEAVLLHPIREVGHELFIATETAPDDARRIVGGCVQWAGGIGGEDEVLDIPGDKGEGAVGGAVSHGVPIVVRPIEIGSPEVENKIVGKGIDIHQLSHRVIDGL